MVQLINRLQRACGSLGEHAGSDIIAGLPNLWNLLPSVVVIGGQVPEAHELLCLTCRTTRRGRSQM